MTGEPRCAVGVPNVGPFGDPLLLVELAVAAEEHGWDGFFVWDHLLLTRSALGRWTAPGSVETRFSLLADLVVVLVARSRPPDIRRRSAADVKGPPVGRAPLEVPETSRYLVADSCNLASPSEFRTPVHLWFLASVCAPGHGVPDAPRPGAGQAGPARISCLRGPQRSLALKPGPQGRRRRRCAAGLTPEGQPVPSRGASPRPPARSAPVMSGEAAS